MTGPLSGVRVLEFASIGPGPFCAMLLSDMGADVIRIDRPSGVGGAGPNAVLQRGRPSIVLDLKDARARELAFAAGCAADVLIEGNRPGVMERLELGPERLLQANEQLIYARMTGYGQSGPLAAVAGHDINYLALVGALDVIGDGERPPHPPLNLLGDFGGGALYLAFGILAALFERTRSGRGQVVDAAIVDGSASLMGMALGAFATGSLARRREANILSGAAPFYRCYRCADGKYIAVGALEPQFYARFLTAMGVEDFDRYEQRDPSFWPDLSRVLEAKFAGKPSGAWLELLAPLDACISAVNTVEEALANEHAKARDMFMEVAGLAQPAPAPRFSRTPGAIRSPMARPNEGGREALARWGVA